MAQNVNNQAAGWPVVGHEWAVDLLRRAITSGRLSHAYLLTGPAQVGKTTLARAFSQALLCERAPEGPCGECRACKRISQGRYPDLQIVAAEKNTLQIEQVRNLQADAALSPLEGRYKIFILREIERATQPAANALLKTLEEPPANVLLILTAARPHLVLPTILSRCQVVGLRPLPLVQIETALVERWQVPAERATLLARLSAGRPGWAIAAATDQHIWDERAARLDDLLTLLAGDYYVRLTYTEALSRRADAVDQVLGLWASWWRDLLLVRHGLSDAIVNVDRRVQLTQQAELYPPQQIAAALADIMATLRRLHANVNVRLALDVLALRLPRPAVG